MMGRLKERKATGHDDTPVEVFEAIPEARRELHELVWDIWKLWHIPQDFALVVFVMLYKGKAKGPADSHDAYRPVGLLLHALKIVTGLLLEDVREQAGPRALRCRRRKPQHPLQCRWSCRCPGSLPVQPGAAQTDQCWWTGEASRGPERAFAARLGAAAGCARTPPHAGGLVVGIFSRQA